jgi:hypothetical protein
LLALLALEVVYAVVAEGRNPGQADPIAAALDGSVGSPLGPGVNDCVCRHVTS